MSDNSNEQNPSQTAMMAALHRTIAYKEYENEILGPDYLAEKFLPGSYRFLLRFGFVRRNTRNNINEQLPGVHAYMIARTAYFDEQFKAALEKRIPQIVLMGAGYDSRAFRFDEINMGTRIFELDTASTLSDKIQLIEKARMVQPENLNFVPIDFNTQSLEEVLKKAGWDSGKQTLFIWEGVTYYLEFGAVSDTLEFVGKQAGSRIAFDYTVKVDDSNRDLYGVEKFAKGMAANHKNEAMLFSIPEGEIENRLASHGLKLLKHMDNEEIEETYLLDENFEVIDHITGHFRFVATES